MKIVYKKVNIVEYSTQIKDRFDKFKNVEKLKVIDEVDSKNFSKDTHKKYFLCKNQNGNPVVKSDFMLNYSYKKLANGNYIPLDNKKILACQVEENLQFSTSFGEICKIRVGDYIIIDDKLIYGMKKKEFEENYKTLYKANKILKSYLEEDKTF